MLFNSWRRRKCSRISNESFRFFQVMDNATKCTENGEMAKLNKLCSEAVIEAYENIKVVGSIWMKGQSHGSLKRKN